MFIVVLCGRTLQKLTIREKVDPVVEYKAVELYDDVHLSIFFLFFFLVLWYCWGYLTSSVRLSVGRIERIERASVHARSLLEYIKLEYY